MFKNTFFVIGNRKIHLNQFPLPTDYYQQQFPNLKPYENNWISVRRCFHEDRQPSLRLNLKNGSFRCFGCGERGGSVMAFHSRRYQLNFVQTVLELGGYL